MHTRNQKLKVSIPREIEPDQHGFDKVSQFLESAAYFPIFSIHDPGVPNKPVFSLRSPFGPIAVEVNESLHRFSVVTNTASWERSAGATNLVGEEVANVQIRWTVIPDDFNASPNFRIPPTSLNPFRSQRFAMVNGSFRFKDGLGGFKGFGTGRTFPAKSEGRLRIGAVVDILEGYGQLAGATGTVVINGFIEPPQGLALNMMVRILDPEHRLRSANGLTPIQPKADADPSATFMAFLGEVDTDRPVQLLRSNDGQIHGSMVYEKLRLVDMDFGVDSVSGIHSTLQKGPIVGSLSAQLSFNPQTPSVVSPISTRKGEFCFHDGKGNWIGTIRADMVEGRAFKTYVKDLAFPIFRFAGFGPILGGSGQFENVDGMMSMNAAISVFPRTLSNLYIFRIYDPGRRFRKAYANAWNSSQA